MINMLTRWTSDHIFTILVWSWSGLRVELDDQVLVDTEMYNSGDVEEEAGDLGNGVHLHILNRGEFPYK